MVHRSKSAATRLGLSALFAATCLSAASPAAAAPWTKGYIVEWLNPAFYFGGDPENPLGPGTDCAKGTNPFPGYDKMLRTKWRDEKGVEYYYDAEHRPELQRVIRFRGPNYENVWEEPWTAPDLGMPQVNGKIAYGFDLDGKADTGGFIAPDGRTGIDHAYYRAAGCWLSYRGETFKTPRGIATTDKMRNGQFTVLMVVSGKNDPMNDEDVTIGFYSSKDKIVKDATGQVAHEASFAVEEDPLTQSIVPARIKDGVLETKGPVTIRMRDESHFLNMPRDLVLNQAKLRMDIEPNGAMKGIMAGYRSWKALYRKQAVAGRDVEMNTRIDLPSFYYALERNADGGPLDPKTKKHTEISIAYRLHVAPAFVVTPNGEEVVAVPRIFQPTKTASYAGDTGVGAGGRGGGAE